MASKSQTASNVSSVDDEGWEITHKEFAATWSPANDGDFLQGTYTGYKTLEQEDLNNPGGTRLVNLYEITDSDGKEWGIWESHNIALGFQDVEPGDMVRVVYIGTVPLDSGRTVKQFRIYRKSAS